MKTIEISQEDYEFLKDLQNELNTQTTDGNAQPVYWGVMESKDVAVPDGCGETYIQYDDGKWTLGEAVHEVEEFLASLTPQEKIIKNDFGEESTLDEQWEAVDHENIVDVFDFMYVECKWDNIALYDFVKEDYICRYTGAFLTKRACKNYIEKYKYNHNNPRTYAMTAYRNFELERLLKILREMKLNEE